MTILILHIKTKQKALRLGRSNSSNGPKIKWIRLRFRLKPSPQSLLYILEGTGSSTLGPSATSNRDAMMDPRRHLSPRA